MDLFFLKKVFNEIKRKKLGTNYQNPFIYIDKVREKSETIAV